MYNRQKVEILAPCGSYEIMLAAVNAGADACYFGGNRFGARAYAENFDTDTILRAIDYAHLRGVKLYMTVNTLFKNDETEALYDYLAPLYAAGLDAVIVQDLGVFSLIREQFDRLPIHLSTQMNITSAHAAAHMEALGATRVVPARELSFDELLKIKKNTSLELEVFVHGAMCYSVSGQCLMSSLAGGRSGNRGRCAQTCRKCYNGKYYLSMKDLCTLQLIPQFILSGVDSFKIEGRMKNAAYVSSAVYAYKKMTDACLDGKFDFDEAEGYAEKLANIFSRGGFTDGYLTGEKKRAVTLDAPNHTGVKVGTLTGTKEGCAAVLTEKELYKGDVLSASLKTGEILEFEIGSDRPAGAEALIPAPRTKEMRLNTSVRRTKSARVLREFETLIEQGGGSRLLTDATFTARVGERAVLTLKAHTPDGTIAVSEESTKVTEPAKKPDPNVAETAKEKLLAFGGTPFLPGTFRADISPDAFLPAGELKRMRRAAMEKLSCDITMSYKRELPGRVSVHREIPASGARVETAIAIHITRKEHVDAFFSYALRHPGREILLIFEVRLQHLIRERLSTVDASSIKLIPTLPYFVKSAFVPAAYLQNVDFHGIYIRNLDGLCSLKDLGNCSDTTLYFGDSLYAYNDCAIRFLTDFAESELNIPRESCVFELPAELNLKELRGLCDRRIMYPVYGHRQVMISKQCFVNNSTGCRREYDVNKLTDENGHEYFVKSYCCDCINIIYNGVPTDLRTMDQSHAHLIPEYLFTVESGEEMLRILEGGTVEAHTTGHIKRGVE